MQYETKSVPNIGIGTYSERKASKMDELIEKLKSSIYSLEGTERRIFDTIQRIDGSVPQDGTIDTADKPLENSTFVKLIDLADRLASVSSKMSQHAYKMEDLF